VEISGYTFCHFSTEWWTWSDTLDWASVWKVSYLLMSVFCLDFWFTCTDFSVCITYNVMVSDSHVLILWVLNSDSSVPIVVSYVLISDSHVLIIMSECVLWFLIHMYWLSCLSVFYGFWFTCTDYNIWVCFMVSDSHVLILVSALHIMLWFLIHMYWF